MGHLQISGSSIKVQIQGGATNSYGRQVFLVIVHRRVGRDSTCRGRGLDMRGYIGTVLRECMAISCSKIGCFCSRASNLLHRELAARLRCRCSQAQGGKACEADGDLAEDNHDEYREKPVDEEDFVLDA